jgi:iron complex transport system substrate-binding protein
VLRFAAVVLVAAIGSASAAPIALTDDLGRKVELKAPAKRIVTLAPFLTELAFAIGAGHRVVGVSAYSDYPAEAKSLPVVSSALGVSLEQVAALKPDLVLAWRDSFRVEDIEPLERVGAAVYVAHGRRLDDVPGLLRVLGTFTGLDVSAVTSQFRARLADLRARYASRPKVDVLPRDLAQPAHDDLGQPLHERRARDVRRAQCVQGAAGCRADRFVGGGLRA